MKCHPVPKYWPLLPDALLSLEGVWPGTRLSKCVHYSQYSQYSHQGWSVVLYNIIYTQSTYKVVAWCTTEKFSTTYAAYMKDCEELMIV